MQSQRVLLNTITKVYPIDNMQPKICICNYLKISKHQRNIQCNQCIFKQIYFFLLNA